MITLPGETPTNILPPSPCFHILSSTGDLPAAGPSIEKRTSRLDHMFNFQVVVFEVEDTLFQVPRNGFNTPGTPFEAMFALPQAQTDSIEGSSLENPIHLPGIKAEHFRSFLRVLYPYIDQTPVVEFDEWAGVANLATMWVFQEIREKAITKLSVLIKPKTVVERIALAREFRVPEWLRDAYLELIEKKTLDFEKLRPAEPYSFPLDGNWADVAKKWEAISREWETLAKIFYIQSKVTASVNNHDYFCAKCQMYYGASYSRCLCKCRISAMVDEVFRGELESLKENPP